MGSEGRRGWRGRTGRKRWKRTGRGAVEWEEEEERDGTIEWAEEMERKEERDEGRGRFATGA